MSYEPDRSGKSDSFPRRKTEKPNSDKDKAFDIEQLQNAIRTLTNEVVGLKKTNFEASPSRGISEINLGKTRMQIIKIRHLT